MADLGTDDVVVHGTTTGDGLTVDTAQVGTAGEDVETIEILNRGSDELWARADGQDPGVDADGSHVIPAGNARVISLRPSGRAQVRLISATAVACSVTKV